MAKITGLLAKVTIPFVACCLVAALAGVSRAEEKPHLSGNWKFNPKQSDDAQAEIRDAQEHSSISRRGSGGGYPGGRVSNGGSSPEEVGGIRAALPAPTIRADAPRGWASAAPWGVSESACLGAAAGAAMVWAAKVRGSAARMGSAGRYRKDIEDRSARRAGCDQRRLGSHPAPLSGREEAQGRGC